MKVQDVSKVLVVNTAGLGDVIMSTPLPRALKAWKSGLRVDFLGWESARPLFRGNPGVDRFWGLNKGVVQGALPASWREQGKMIGGLRGVGYDLLLDLSPNGRTLVLALASAVKIKATIRHGWRTRFYDFELPLLVRKYQGEMLLDLLRLLGIPAQDPSPALWPDAELKAGFLAALPKPGQGRRVGLHMGGGWPGKFWPLDHFRRLALLLAEKGFLPVILFGPGEEAAAQALAETLKGSGYLPPLLGLAELIALISCCDAVVSNDSGPRHMAAGLGVPTLGLFGPTWPVSVLAPQGRDRGLSVALGCGPCDKTGCPDTRCLREIPPERVFAELEALLRVAPRG